MIQPILGTDKLESGFRSKYNQSINEIWVSAIGLSDGRIKVTKFDGTFVYIDLSDSFYTITEVQDLIAAIGISPATEDAPGIIQIATKDEVDLGENQSKALTPFTGKYSTLFPFKGNWESTFGEVGSDPLTGGYSIGMIVVSGGDFYKSLADDNKAAVSDTSKWQIMGGGISLITKSGSEVNTTDGTLDLSSESIPDFPRLPTVYINGVAGEYQIQYNNTTKIISGLYGVDTGAVITIKF